jgi:hypothetical protein
VGIKIFSKVNKTALGIEAEIPVPQNSGTDLQRIARPESKDRIFFQKAGEGNALMINGSL